MKNLISIVVLIITLFSTSIIQAVETKYIPSNSQAVFSIKLNELSSKAEISLQNTLNKLFMQKFADNFAAYRDDAVALDCLNGILGARRAINARSWEQGRNKALIKPDRHDSCSPQ